MIARLLAGLVVVVLFFNQAFAQLKLALIDDCSGSMSGQKFAALKETAKLTIALLDGELVVISFHDTATVSPVFPLDSPDDRRAAMQYVDELEIGGGTNYVAAMREYRRLPKGTVAVFISDGENTEKPDSEVINLAVKAPGPIYTVAIEASDEAEDLLNQMAATSGGAATSIDNVEDLTKTILRIVQGLGNYRAYTPQETMLRFPGTSGSVIGIGYDDLPNIEGNPPFKEPPFQHRAKLNEHVVLSRVNLHTATDIVIRSLQKRRETGRLAKVLRNDLPHSTLEIDAKDGTTAAGGIVQPITRFTDPATGNVIDPRTDTNLMAGYLLQNEQGQTIGKVRAKPHPTEPALTAPVPIPAEPGTYNIVQITRVNSTGVPFDDSQSRTIIAKVPLRLVAFPAVLTASVEPGTFQVTFTVGTDGNTEPPPTDFTATVNSQAGGIKLGKCIASNSRVTLDFLGQTAGTFIGTVLLQPTSGNFAPLAVPYRFTIAKPYLGLAIPQSIVDLGAYTSNAGQVALPPIEISALDTDPFDYQVQAGDLSNGRDVIPVRCTTNVLRPVKNKPAELRLAVTLGDVAPGTYTGSITLARSGAPAIRDGQLRYQIAVLDALAAQPIDFGPVEPGGSAQSQLVIHNDGPQVAGLQLIAQDVAAQRGLIEVTGPERLPVIVAQNDTAVTLTVFVSEVVSSRGPHAGAVTLRRPGGHDTVVPVRLAVVERGKGPKRLVVSPEKIQLSGRAGEVLEFELSVKLAAGLQGNDEVLLRSEALDNSAGQATDSIPEFQWAGANVVTPTATARAKGFVLAPLEKGSYRTHISVQTGRFGSVDIPVTLEVR